MANPNPSPATRFRRGQVANPRGKTSAQRTAEIRNAELAAKLRTHVLKALLAEAKADPAGTLRLIERNILRFLKDCEDRGLGQPQGFS